MERQPDDGPGFSRGYYEEAREVLAVATIASRKFFPVSSMRAMSEMPSNLAATSHFN